MYPRHRVIAARIISTSWGCSWWSSWNPRRSSRSIQLPIFATWSVSVFSLHVILSVIRGINFYLPSFGFLSSYHLYSDESCVSISICGISTWEFQSVYIHFLHNSSNVIRYLNETFVVVIKKLVELKLKDMSFEQCVSKRPLFVVLVHYFIFMSCIYINTFILTIDNLKLTIAISWLRFLVELYYQLRICFINETRN